MGLIINILCVVLLLGICSNAKKCYHDGLQYYSADTLAISCTASGTNYELHTGDFNGDGRYDIYCHDTSLANPDWFALATSSGTFYTIQNNGAKGFCESSTGRIHVGDFDGDGRDDLLCQYADGKTFKISYFLRHKFSSGMKLFTTLTCDYNLHVLRFGDFNDDGIADLVCLDTSKGKVSFVFKKPYYRGRRHQKSHSEKHHVYTDPRLRKSKNGMLQLPFTFCQGAGKKFVVGHFSNDRLADLGCFDPATGKLEITLSKSDQMFHKSIIIDVGNTFCSNPTMEIFSIKDINGDNMDDLICLKDNNGNVDEEILYGNDQLQFIESKFKPSVLSGTCFAGEVLFGDFNGDGLMDIGCDSSTAGNDFIGEFATCEP